MIIVWIVCALIVLLVLVVVIRALPKKTAAPVDAIPEADPLRSQRYGEGLSHLIQVETVSHVDDPDKQKFYGFHETLKKEFPLLFAQCEVHEFSASLLFKWTGKSNQEPILLMNHFDVVEASGQWKHLPFSGDISDGKVHGRGAVDDKGPLYVMLQSVEELLAEGYVPAHDIYLASTCTEEIGGDGAPMIAAYLKEQGIYFNFMLDEGGMVVHEPLPGLKGLYAMVGVEEKSTGNLKFIARSGGGHASAPGKATPLVRLGAFMAEIDRHYPLPAQLSDPFKEMIRRLSASLPFSFRLVTENMWLFSGLLKVVAKSVPPLAAMLRTTVAFTVAKGADGYNVLPQEAYVVANIRYIPTMTIEESNAILINLAHKYKLDVEILDQGQPIPVVDYRGDAFKRVEATIAEIYPGVTITPYIMTGGTDSRFYTELSNNAIRFAPLYIDDQQYHSIHGLDESINCSSLPGGVDFYKRLIHKYNEN